MCQIHKQDQSKALKLETNNCRSQVCATWPPSHASSDHSQRQSLLGNTGKVNFGNKPLSLSYIKNYLRRQTIIALMFKLNLDFGYQSWSPFQA